jgi:hypothetical protein
MGFSQKAYINLLFSKEAIRHHLSAAHAFRVPAGQR